MKMFMSFPGEKSFFAFRPFPYQLTQFITLSICKPRCVSTIIKPDFCTDFAFAFTIVNIFPTHKARLSCEYLHLPGVLAEFQ